MKELLETGFNGEQVTIPDLLPANIINCENEQDAARLVLVYSSVYAKTAEQGITEFIKNFNLDITELNKISFIQGINYDKIELNLNNLLKDDVEINEDKNYLKPLSKYGDMFKLGAHKIICCDSTKRKDLDKLFKDITCDILFTDPPYDLENTEWFKIARHYVKDKVLFVMYSDKYNVRIAYENFDIFKKFFVVTFSSGILLSNKDVMSKHILVSHFGIETNRFVNLNDNATTHYEDYNKSGQLKNKIHKHTKSSKLIEFFLTHFSKKNHVVLDLFLGSGTTLLTSEKLGRVCYGSELDPKFIDLILMSYHKKYPIKKIVCLNRDFDFNKLWSTIK